MTGDNEVNMAEETPDVEDNTLSYLAQAGNLEDAMLVKQLKAQRKVRILIPSGRGGGERAPVPVSVNGHAYLIVRDKEVEVPESVMHALELAQEDMPVEEHDPVTGRQQIRFEKAHRFPFRLIGYVDELSAREEQAKLKKSARK
jgi:hypothetical protein